MANNLKKLSLVLFLGIIVIASEATDYCSIAKKQCGGGDHAMCVGGKPINYYTGYPYAYDNVTPVRTHRNGNGLLSHNEKKEILNFHNTIRRKVAVGNESRVKNGPLPRSTNMPDLVWDDELEIFAQTSVNDGKFSFPRTSRCAHTKDNRVSENRGFAEIHESQYSFSRNIKAILEEWERDVGKFDANDVMKYKFNRGASRYTQMIWGTTTKIGCGWQIFFHAKARFYKVQGKYGKSGHQYRLLCYYATQGNIENQSVYEVFDHGKIVFHTKFANE